MITITPLHHNNDSNAAHHGTCSFTDHSVPCASRYTREYKEWETQKAAEMGRQLDKRLTMEEAVRGAAALARDDESALGQLPLARDEAVRGPPPAKQPRKRKLEATKMPMGVWLPRKSAQSAVPAQQTGRSRWFSRLRPDDKRDVVERQYARQEEERVVQERDRRNGIWDLGGLQDSDDESVGEPSAHGAAPVESAPARRALPLESWGDITAASQVGALTL